MKNKVIEYVMNSPENTNRAVLESMLEAINGGSASKKKVFYLTGNEEDVTAQYPIDELITMLWGERVVKLSEEPLTADEMNRTFVATSPYEGGAFWHTGEFSIANGGIIEGFDGGIHMAGVAMNGTPVVISILESVDVEGVTIQKGLYFGLDLFLEKEGSTGKRIVYHMLIACGA